MPSPVGDTVDFLNTNVGTLTTGTNLFEGRLRDGNGIDENNVFVAGIGGPPPSRRMGQTIEVRESLINIFIRHKVWKEGFDIAQSIIDAFNGNTSVPTGFLDAEPLGTLPLDSGVDSTNRYLFTLSLRLVHEESTQ